MEKKPNLLCSSLERAICSFFYNGYAGRSSAISVGLQVPIWMWTHHITVESERVTREVQKVVHLVRWFYDNGANMSSVTIIAPADMKAKLREQLLHSLQDGEEEEESAHANKDTTLPMLFAPHEITAMNARDKCVHHYEVILYLLAFPPTSEHLHSAMQQDQFIADAITSAKSAFILIADAGWTAPHFMVHWPHWRTFVMKLKEESVLVPGDKGSSLPDGARLPSLVGPRIPLCCPRHVDYRQLECGVAPILRSCKRLCLQPFACQKEAHVCTDPCHPRVSHGSCPYACESLMPCGHECLHSCNERCNCFEIIERPLPCTHPVVIGLDEATLQPIYAVVRHVFKGYCADAHLPCAVEFTTECARCLGALSTTCCEAAQQGHTAETKTIICPSCTRMEREVRAKVLGEVLIQTEEAKRRMKVEVQRSVHQQRKASSQGLFLEGSRVTIFDVTKIIKPLCAETDFPGVTFVDYDAPDFYSSMNGAYGTFISRHVDIDDLSEVRNLIRLRDGSHVLVADGGLRLISAITSSITQRAPTLLLTYDNTGKTSEDLTVSEEALTSLSKMVGRSYYLTLPVPFGDGTLSDKVVRVTAVDPASEGNVLVECRLPSVVSRADEERHDGGVVPTDSGSGDASVNALKKQRTEAATTWKMSGPRVSVETVSLSVPATALESMDGYVVGKEVLVLDPSHQIKNPHDVQVFEAIIAGTPSLNLSAPVISTTPVGRFTPFTLLGIVNAPSSLERYGPCAVLRQRRRLVTVRTGRGGRDRRYTTQYFVNGAPSSGSGSVHGSSAADGVVIIIPFVFTAADQFLEAENSLDAAALEKVEQRVRDIITEKCDELLIRNDEDAYHRQRQMPEVTEEVLAQDRVAYSSPVPLPTAEHLASVRTRHARLLRDSPVSLRLSKQRDTLLSKQQQLGLNKWLEAMRQRHEQDVEADGAYFRALQLKRPK
ncbi:hypothetical protein TRVL_05683 [Trypanosoma vivax]|nr:hypothetical protein TRVL_05683 [Trypanosoma vivax]